MEREREGEREIEKICINMDYFARPCSKFIALSFMCKLLQGDRRRGTHIGRR